MNCPQRTCAKSATPMPKSGSRRTVPTPFYEADKSRLKAQIGLLLTEDVDPLLK